MKEYLDLRKAPWNKEENNIYRGASRQVAIEFGKSYGWPPSRVQRACNWIDAWWVLVQCNGDQMTFLCRDGSWCTLPYPGYVTR